MKRTLIAIFAFMGISLGLFIWFIANWDKTATQPIGSVSEPRTQMMAHGRLPVWAWKAAT